MDYDDIDKIAESMTDDINSNNGLSPGISLKWGDEHPRITKYRGASQTISGDYDIPNHAKTVQPLLNRHGLPAKSVTIVESLPKRVKSQNIPPKVQPPKANDIPTFGMSKRALEL